MPLYPLPWFELKAVDLGLIPKERDRGGKSERQRTYWTQEGEARQGPGLAVP